MKSTGWWYLKRSSGQQSPERQSDFVHKKRDVIQRDMVLRDMERRPASPAVNRRNSSAFMACMGTHRNWLAWQEAMKLVAMVYRETAAYPKDERYGLIAQTRRAAVSIPSNIAEGAGRNSTGELIQYLGIASGSLAELETEIELGAMLSYLPDDTAMLRQAHRVGRLLSGLRSSLRNKD
jgi:four helix bundle protein